MKKTLHKLLVGILVSLLAYFLASCQDLTGPQGEPGKNGQDAVLPPDIGEALRSALAAKTEGDGKPWIVKISGLDFSDPYTARQIFHGVAAGIPDGDIELDLSECAGAFFGYDPGVSRKDKARFTGLTLPDSLTNISDGKEGTLNSPLGAFADFANLKRIRSVGLLRVGDYAFLGCAALETLDLPQVTAIGDYAFAANTSTTGGSTLPNNTVLTRVDLPNVTTIGKGAFFRCLVIAELNLPEAVDIGWFAFAGVPDTPNSALQTVYLPKAETIGAAAFQYCNRVSSVSLPNAYAFQGTTFAAAETHPNTVLTEVTLPEAASLGGDFAYCTALTTVHAPEARSIGYQSFKGCTALTRINAPNVTSIGVSAFADCTALTGTTVDTAKVTFVDNYAFEGCTALTDLELPSVREFAWAPFRYCDNLTTLKLGSFVPAQTSSTNATRRVFANTGSANAALTIRVPVASQAAYTTAGWTDTAANGAAATWGTNHKQIIMDTY
jgi:hypothetical protein